MKLLYPTANNNKYIFTLILAIIIRSHCYAQTAPAKYWVQFTDKNATPYSIITPLSYLSQRAVDRRIRQNIQISENDLPLDPVYVDSILNSGAITLLTRSKWFNAISIQTTDTLALAAITGYSFVAQLKRVAVIHGSNEIGKGDFVKTNTKSKSSVYYNHLYGMAYDQIMMLNGQALHDEGFKGKGIMIAILDAGFYNTDIMSAFDSLRNDGRIIAMHDMVDGDNYVYHTSHGSWVLSCMAGILPGEFYGTAVDASYVLLRTEDGGSENIIEEDNWIAGAEYADSVGVDIINTSLGYATFDDSTQDHTYLDMDGNTTRIAIGADIAASKGILCVTSAGNQGNALWYNITTPADADSTLAVGAVDLSGNYATFSGKGPSSDGDVKPNVAAAGSNMYVADVNGGIMTGSGTSFSSPIIAGMAACLWQAHPNATNMEIKSAIEKSATQYYNPDIFLGYGIPDFYKAHLILSGIDPVIFTTEELIGVSTMFSDNIKINFYSGTDQTIVLKLFDINGRICYTEDASVRAGQFFISRIDDGIWALAAGSYILQITTATNRYNQKLFKQ